MRSLSGIRVFIICLLLFIAKDVFCQEFSSNFFGTKYHKYKGLNAKLDLEKGGSHLDIKVFASIPDSVSDFDKLAGDLTKFENKVFLIDSVFDFKEGYDNGISKVFRLTDKSYKTRIYYVYDTSMREFHYLLTEFGKGGFDSFYEDQIEREVDDFTGEIRINTPLLSDLGSISKYIRKGKTTYYFSTSIKSEGIYKGRGVVILFSDGSKWSRPNEIIDLDYSDGFQNNVFLTLSTSDLDIFKKKVIKKIRLYIHDKDVDSTEAENFRKLVNVILKRK